MKKIYTILSIAFFVFFSVPCFAQNTEPGDDGGSLTTKTNDATHPCITQQEYVQLEKQCAENIKLLGLDKPEQRSINATSLNWPLRAATGFNDCSFYVITAYVDQNATASAVKDWNCGSNTYDSHRGTDIAITPFSFYKMDNNQVEVIAAAPGTILYKSDGHFDRNCAGNSDTANYIVIRHADGTQANYWHMKKNSVTSKTVGQTVAAGEYLGVVGSSGSSSGPHLHFEVWTGSTVSTLNDPFSGNCNSLNANSWWAAQKPYTEPAAIKVSVNTTDLVVPACPATETSNESSSFTIPFQGAGLSPGYAKFYLFMRNETSGLTANLSILNPNGTTFNSWTYSSTANYNASYRGFSKLLPTTAGTYTFKATYNGTTCSTTFDIVTTTPVTELQAGSNFTIYPNPASNSVNVSVSEELVGSTLTVTDITGKKVSAVQLTTLNTKISTAEFINGIYFAVISNNKQTVTRKLTIAH